MKFKEKGIKMEIEVGEYVRLVRNQGINKIIEIEDDGECYVLDNNIADEWGEEISYLFQSNIEEEIVKHSKNIIDLIEVGDYVNGLRVEYITNEVIFTSGLAHGILFEDIRTVVTKEQFESIEYKIGN